MEEKRKQSLSKLLTYILRYKPEKFQLSFSEKGYCKLEDLVAITKRHSHKPVTEEEICYVLLTSKWRDEIHRFDVWKGYVRAAYIPMKRSK